MTGSLATTACAAAAGRLRRARHARRLPTQPKSCASAIIAPTTGIFAQVGKDMVDGFQMYLDEVKGDFAGAKVKLIVEDEPGQAGHRRHQGQEAHPAGQGAHAGRRRAGHDRLCAGAGEHRDKTVYIASVAAADDLTQRDLPKYPYIIRTGWTSSQPHHPLGQWACEQGYKRIVAIAADYAFGHEIVGGFQKAFEDCGGQIVQKIWPPLGTKDFGPYIPTIKADADAIFTLMVGPMVAAIPQAACGRRHQEADHRRRHQLRRIRPAGHGRRGDRRRLGAAVQRGARHAEERGVREEVPRQVRQGAVVLLGDQLHHARR